MTGTLRGRRVLVVEDETLVAILIESMLEDLGCIVVGPAGSIDEAISLLGATPPELAILDVNLDGRQAFPLAERLLEVGVPIVFSTGYGRAGLPDRWQDRPVVTKPYRMAELAAAAERALAGD